MKIMIVQAEIETAIRDYILSQINIREGMSVTIELAATRGASGFTAEIDISQTVEITSIFNAKEQLASYQKAAGPSQLAPVETLKSAFPAFNIPRTPQTPSEVRQMMEATADEPEKTDIVISEPVVVVANDSEAATAEASEEVAPPKTQSLFKGLRKPVNA